MHLEIKECIFTLLYIAGETPVIISCNKKGWALIFTHKTNYMWLIDIMVGNEVTLYIIGEHLQDEVLCCLFLSKCYHISTSSHLFGGTNVVEHLLSVPGSIPIIVKPKISN